MFFADLTVLKLITTVWGKLSQILYLPEFIEQVSQIVFLAYFTVLGLFYHYIKNNVTKLISTRVLWTSITNRVFCLLHRSRAFYNYIRKNVTKLIFPRVLWTSITNRVPSWFDRFTALQMHWRKMSRNSYLRELCAHVSQNVFLADSNVSRHSLTIWAKL